ncbi:ORF75 [Silurid herpesvirus 1]|nr:ORF75 [Silurid herpesvirus 1]
MALSLAHCIHCTLETHPPGRGSVLTLSDEWWKIFMVGECAIINKRNNYQVAGTCERHRGLPLIGPCLAPNPEFYVHDPPTGLDLPGLEGPDFLDAVHPWFKVLLDAILDRLDDQPHGDEAIIVNFGRSTVPTGVYVRTWGTITSCLAMGPGVGTLPEMIVCPTHQFGNWFSWLIIKPRAESGVTSANDLTKRLLGAMGFATGALERFQSPSPTILYIGKRWVVECVPHLYPTLPVARAALSGITEPNTQVLIWAGPVVPVIGAALEAVICDKVRDLATVIGTNYENVLIYSPPHLRVTTQWQPIARKPPALRITFTLAAHNLDVLRDFSGTGEALGYTAPGVGYITELDGEPTPGRKLPGPGTPLDKAVMGATSQKFGTFLSGARTALSSRPSVQAWTITIVVINNHFGLLTTILETCT